MPGNFFAIVLAVIALICVVAWLGFFKFAIEYADEKLRRRRESFAVSVIFILSAAAAFYLSFSLWEL